MRTFYAVLTAVLLGGVLVLGQQEFGEAIVERVTVRQAITAYGDQVLVSDVVARQPNGVAYGWTAVGGNTRAGGMAFSNEPIFRVGDKVRVRGKRVEGGQSAFTLLGHAWAVAQVDYRVNPFSTQLDVATWTAAIDAAAAPWNAAGAGIALADAGPTSVDVFVRDGVNAIFTRISAEGWTGNTAYWWDATGAMVDADVAVNELYLLQVHPQECLGGFYVENTLTHEFGHVLGLGHSDVAEATMWPYTSACETERETLAQDDLDGLFALYPNAPPPPPPPVEEICGDGIDNDGDGLVDENCARPCKKRGRWAC